MRQTTLHRIVHYNIDSLRILRLQRTRKIRILPFLHGTAMSYFDLEELFANFFWIFTYH